MQRLTRFISELKRRNVFRAGAAYLVLAWLAVQIADILLDVFAAPDRVIRTLILALSLGFPVTLILSWVYEITVEGVKLTEEVLPNESITDRTGRKFDFIVIGLLSVAVAVFALDRFVWRQNDYDAATATYNYSLAVLPFDLSSEVIAPFFGQLSSELARLLQRNHQLRLASVDAIEAIPTNSSNPNIADQLGVRYLVSGAIRSGGQGTIVGVSLFDAKIGDEMWANQFDDPASRQTTYAVAESILAKIGVESLSTPIRTVDPRAFELYLRARRHMATDELRNSAEDLYREALAVEPRFPLALAGLCSYLVSRYSRHKALRDFEEAERVCFRAWTIDAQAVEVQQALGRLYQESGQNEKARESYSAALSVNPNDLVVQVALARTYEDEQPDLAETQIRSIIQQHPGSPTAYHALTSLYFKQGKYVNAIEPAKWAVRLRPDDDLAKLNLVSSLGGAGMFEEAKSLLITVLDDGTERKAWAENNLATVLFFEGDYAGAASLYRNAIERDPEDSLGYRNLGDAIWHLDGKDAAEHIFRSAIDLAKQRLEINPEDYYVVGNLVVAYASIGDSENHKRTLDILNGLNTTDPATQYDIAVAASRLGDLAMSRRHAKRALELGMSIAQLRADPDILASGASFD